MTRSSTKELFTPYKEPEREFRSSRRHFKTLSLDELRSSDFNLLSDQEYSKEEVMKTMAETMEQYMSKTRADYRSGVVRPNIKDRDNFELKGQFLKELRTNTFSGSDHEDANEHIEKVLKMVDLFHIPNINMDQVMLRAFPMSLTGAASRWLRNEQSGSITTWDGLKTKFLNKYCPPARTARKMEEINNFQQELDENIYQAWERFKELLMKCPQHYLTEMHEVILFYNGLGIPTRQILDSRGAIPSKTVADAKVGIQEMAEYSKKWHNGTSRSRSTKTSDGLAAIQAQLNNLGRDIKKVNEKVYAAQVGCEQCKGPHYTKDCPLKEEGKTLKEAYYTQFSRPFQGGDIEQQLRAKIHEENSNLIKEIQTSTDAAIQNEGHLLKLWNQNRANEQGASVSVMPLSTYLNLRFGKLAHTKLTVELADMTVKYLKGIAENVPVDHFLSTARAKIDVYKRKITLRVGEERIVFISVKPASSLVKRVYMLSLKERMELDLEARLIGETLVLNGSLDPFFEDYIELNDLNEPFELRRNQGDDLMPTIEEGEVIEEFRTRDDELDIGIDDYPSYYDYDKKIHIDCAHNLMFSCMIGFEFTHANFFPLLYVNVMSKKFHNSIMKDKMVYKGNNVVGALMNVPIFVGTFSVVTDFAVLENMDAYRDEGMGDVIFGEPFLREVGIKTKWFEGIITIYNGDDEVSEKDKMNGVSHAYQKLKGFYKGVLKLGPDCIRDAKTEEWLTRWHISVHEME
ncbi:reverse transcriptase domain-containing protein [Tanacetum coccineum]